MIAGPIGADGLGRAAVRFAGKDDLQALMVPAGWGVCPLPLTATSMLASRDGRQRAAFTPHGCQPLGSGALNGLSDSLKIRETQRQVMPTIVRLGVTG